MVFPSFSYVPDQLLDLLHHPIEKPLKWAWQSWNPRCRPLWRSRGISEKTPGHERRSIGASVRHGPPRSMVTIKTITITITITMMIMMMMMMIMIMMVVVVMVMVMVMVIVLCLVWKITKLAVIGGK